MPDTYLTERFQLAKMLGAPVRICSHPHQWGAQVMQTKLAHGELTVTVTDTEMTNPGTGDLVRCLSGWELQRRRAFADLHWHITIHTPGGAILVRQQAVDTEYRSLLAAIRQALAYALESLEMETV